MVLYKWLICIKVISSSGARYGNGMTTEISIYYEWVLARSFSSYIERRNGSPLGKKERRLHDYRWTKTNAREHRMGTSIKH